MEVRDKRLLVGDWRLVLGRDVSRGAVVEQRMEQRMGLWPTREGIQRAAATFRVSQDVRVVRWLYGIHVSTVGDPQEGLHTMMRSAELAVALRAQGQQAVRHKDVTGGEGCNAQSAGRVVEEAEMEEGLASEKGSVGRARHD